MAFFFVRLRIQSRGLCSGFKPAFWESVILGGDKRPKIKYIIKKYNWKDN